MSARPRRIALRVAVPALSLDPLTRAVIRTAVLPVGTVLEDVDAALADAAVRHLESVVVRTVDGDGWCGLERVETESLRGAVG